MRLPLRRFRAAATAAVLLALWAGPSMAAQADAASAVQPATATAAACPPQARLPAPAELQKLARQARNHGLLWRVRHEGRTSWLYGTIHVGKLEWLMPGPDVVRAVQAADSLALELDVTNPEVLQQLGDGLRARPDATALPAALAQRLAQQRKAACADDSVAAMRPEAQLMALQNRCCRMYGPQTHAGRIQPCPLCVDNAAQWLQVPALDGAFGCQQQQRCTIGNLGTVAGCDIAPRLVEYRFELGQPFWRGIAAHAIVMRIKSAFVVCDGNNFLQLAGLLRSQCSGMAFSGIGIHGLAVYLELTCQVFSGLTHAQTSDRVCQPFEQADDRLEHAGTQAAQNLQPVGQ